MGSTPAARHAGSADASNAASPNANVAEASMTGSQGLTLNNCCVISWNRFGIDSGTDEVIAIENATHL